MDLIQNEYDVILERRDAGEDGSYTAYLFDQGIDKICKKVGEESTEVILAAKNDNRENLVDETVDLLYHVLVLLADRGVTPADIDAKLQERAEKRNNLKTFHKVDKDS